MTYVEGFILAVPTASREAYRSHAADAFPIFEELGVRRHIEAWASDVPEGEVTDFRKAVQAKEDEDVVFAWFEHRSREARDAFNAKMMADPRMEQMGASMPFDAKRMIFGGFGAILERGSGRGAYVDGFVAPVPEGNREAYLAMAEKAAAKFLEQGAVRVVEAWGDDVPDGKLTDFRRAVKAEEGEKVIFSWIEWPDKAARDAAWPKIMADPDMQPDGAMPFDGKRMFWGGFDIILDKAAREREAA
ncbi:MAG TPA: DUF1428 domain-containing protein [Allosphingosinicella sp.]|nr:DUF1428 domain-containing protein [Allosphingosinicella sp.]